MIHEIEYKTPQGEVVKQIVTHDTPVTKYTVRMEFAQFEILSIKAL